MSGRVNRGVPQDGDLSDPLDRLRYPVDPWRQIGRAHV